MRTFEVRAHGVADGEHTAGRKLVTLGAFCLCQRHLIYRWIRFSGVQHFSAHTRIDIRYRACAIDKRRTALDDDVRIAAHHEQFARKQGFEQRTVIVRCFASSSFSPEQTT